MSLSTRLHRRFFKEYKAKREHILSGFVNCIPLPFRRFRKEFPGIERAKNYIVTANSKVGKTQIADFIFVLSPIMYAYKNREKIKLKILYFSLEMSIQEKMSQWTCFWLYWYSEGRIDIDTKTLNSLNEESPLSEEVLIMLESKAYQDFFDFLEDTVIFNETDRNPASIYNICVKYANANGKVIYENVPIEGEPDKTTKKAVAFEWNTPDTYVIKMVDHVGLYSPEDGMSLRETIGKASSRDNVRLRNIYGFTNVDVQQQAADKEGLEAFKMDRLTPTPDGLGENKTTQRDCNVMLGLFSPYRFEKQSWKGYNVTSETGFKDNIRFLEVCLNRNGSAGAVCPLFFNGAVNFFAELPYPDDTAALQRYINMAHAAQNK